MVFFNYGGGCCRFLVNTCVLVLAELQIGYL